MKKELLNTNPTHIFSVIFLAFLLSGTMTVKAYGNLTIYPAKGQSAEQQKQDELECHQWAVDQTGFDPTKAEQVAQPGPAPKGGALRGAAGGALVGLGVGAIAGDAKKGAAIGAGAGAIGGGAKQRQERQQQEAAAQQSQANRQAQIDNYNKARGACLEGRGYSVK